MGKPFFSRCCGILLGSVLIVLLGCSNWPHDAQMLHADYDKYAPNFPESDLAPSVASDGLSNWLVAWQGNSRAQQTGGANCPTGAVKFDVIYTTRSTDGGKTWSSPKCLDTGDGNGSPAVATDGKGNWLVVWSASGGMTGKDGDIFAALSTNKSWSLPSPKHPWGFVQSINTNAMGDQGYDLVPRVVWNGKDKWVAVWMSDEPMGTPDVGTDKDIFFSTSSDGKTWSPTKVLNSNATTDTGNDMSPSIASDGNGNLVVVWQSNDPLGTQNLGTDYDLLISRSSDGLSWSPPEPLNLNAATDQGNDVNPDIAYGAGRWNVVWESDSDLGGTLGTDLDILVSYGTGNGKNWHAPEALINYMKKDKASDMGPRIAYGAGVWHVVWYSDEPLSSASSPAGNDNDIFMAQSINGGTSWSFNGVIHSFGLKDVANDYSPSIATDGKKKWLVVWSSDYPGESGSHWGLDFDILFVTF